MHTHVHTPPSHTCMHTGHAHMQNHTCMRGWCGLAAGGVKGADSAAAVLVRSREAQLRALCSSNRLAPTAGSLEASGRELGATVGMALVGIRLLCLARSLKDEGLGAGGSCDTGLVFVGTDDVVMFWGSSGRVLTH